jgi:hypothetical protein
MSQSQETMRLLGADLIGDRPTNDFYETPEIAITKLLDKERFTGSIWDPASGNGAICKVLTARYGPNLIMGSDIRTDAKTYGMTGIDFLNSVYEADNIIVNPPFSLATEFTLQSFKLARRKIALFQKIQFLEGRDRREKIFKNHAPDQIWVFVNRLSCPDGTIRKKSNGGMMCFAWYIWNAPFEKKQTNGYWTSLGWLD